MNEILGMSWNLPVGMGAAQFVAPSQPLSAFAQSSTEGECSLRIQGLAAYS